MNIFILIAACSLSCPSNVIQNDSRNLFLSNAQTTLTIGSYPNDGRNLAEYARICNPDPVFTTDEAKAQKALAEGERVFDVRVHALTFDVVELSRIPEPQKFTTKETAVGVEP